MKIVISILICALIAFAVAEERSKAPSTSGKPNTIQIELFSGSNLYWIAVAVRNANVDTSAVQVMDSSSNTWASMDYTDGWGYWTYSSLSKVEFPLSFRLVSVNGDQITVSNKIRSLSAGTIDSALQYSTSVAPAPTAAPTAQPTAAATSKGSKHTDAPTAAPTRKATAAPTAAPTATKKGSSTSKATSAPTATAKPTSASSSSGCSAPTKLMVPLYTYPGASWDSVAASGSLVPTVAIINPNSGPGNGPDSSYNTYMAKLHTAKVEMIGYVHTSYGARAIADVKADIDVYASQFPLLVGIFLDEAAATADQVPYYQQLYTYIMSFPGWKYDVINPGTVPTAAYANVATQIVSFEDSASKFAASANPSFASCSNKNMFVVITYAASGTSAMQSALNTAKSKGYYGWVYVTDGAGGCCTYNALTSYYASQASYIASTLN